MLSSSGLQYFAEVARQGTFQAGADRLRVAVSAVSRQIALLEAELGVELFERSRGRRPLRLTAAGEVLMVHVQELEASSARLQSEVSALRGLVKGHIRFGASELFIHHRFPDALAQFSQDHPGITYTVEISRAQRLLGMLAAGELDVALIFNFVPTPGVELLHEVAYGNHALVAASHPLAQRQVLRLSDLAGHGLALPGHGLSTQGIYADMFARARVKPQVVVSSNSYDMLVTAAMSGVAVALVNADLLDRPPAAEGPRYRCVPIDDPLMPAVRVAICTHEKRPVDANLADFILRLRGVLGKGDDIRNKSRRG